MEDRTEVLKVRLPDGREVHAQTTIIGSEEDIAFDIPSFDGVTEAIEGISQALIATLQRVKPKKASVEFGIEIAAESGGLTALIVKGSGNASLKITLEWGE